jgi:Spy/CpxP family protein refolding chaperone
MFGRKLKNSILALALAVPMIGFAQAPPQGPAGRQGPPEWGGQRGPGPGFGQGPGMQRGMRRGPGMDRGRGMRGPGKMRGRQMGQRGLGRMLQNPAMRERLGFTSEQAARIQSQESAFAKARIRQHSDLRVKQMELNELIAADKADRAAIDKKLREVQEARTASEKAGIDHRLAMREMITPKQRQNMQQMLRERRGSEFGPGREPGRGPRGGRPPASPEGRPPAPPVEPND